MHKINKSSWNYFSFSSTLFIFYVFPLYVHQQIVMYLFVYLLSILFIISVILIFLP